MSLWLSTLPFLTDFAILMAETSYVQSLFYLVISSFYFLSEYDCVIIFQLSASLLRSAEKVGPCWTQYLGIHTPCGAWPGCCNECSFLPTWPALSPDCGTHSGAVWIPLSSLLLCIADHFRGRIEYLELFWVVKQVIRKYAWNLISVPYSMPMPFL